MTTHHLELTDETVRKRYASWDRGEPDREWLALTLLHRASPGWRPSPCSGAASTASRRS